MITEFINYQDELDKLNAKKRTCKVLYAIVLPLGILTSGLLGGIPPLGITLLFPCVIGLVVVMRMLLHNRKKSKELEEYRQEHKFSGDRRGDATYCLVSPFELPETIGKIQEALMVVGEVSDVDTCHGIIRGAICISSERKHPVTIYVGQNDHGCKVRACFSRTWNDSWWDMFLSVLFEKNPEVNFGVTPASGEPRVVGVLDLRGDTKQVAVSKTSGGASLGGFLIGGALFGDAGAIVGGLSGERRTVTNSRTVFSNEVLVRLIYSNGRLWEGTVLKGSQLYNEIMVTMM